MSLCKNLRGFSIPLVGFETKSVNITCMYTLDNFWIAGSPKVVALRTVPQYSLTIYPSKGLFKRSPLGLRGAQNLIWTPVHTDYIPYTQSWTSKVPRPTGETDEQNALEDEHLALVQKPPWERDNRGRRSRSNSRERRTWRSANASGWQDRAPNRGSGHVDDGNDHRPWRRRPSTRGTNASASAPSAPKGDGRGSSGLRRDHSAMLGTVMGPQAWQCLLEMRSPLEPVSGWGYGLSESSRNNIEASYGDMTERERQVMHLELIRVLSAVLSDIAQAMTNVLASEGDLREADGEGEEDDHSHLMQKLPPNKARKLEAASKKVVVPDITQAILGTGFDRITRSLMAALERMSSQEASRCAQALANRVVEHYGVAELADLPEDGEAMFSGLVTFGASMGVEHDRLNSMDNYFVTHWWNLLCEVLPRGEISASASGSAGETDVRDTVLPGRETQVNQHRPAAGGLEEGGNVQGWHLTTPANTIDLNDTQLDDPSGVGRPLPAGEVDVPPATREAAHAHADEDRARLNAIASECERFRSAQLQDWEDQVLRDAMSSEPPTGTGILIRGGILRRGTLLSTTQTMSFRLHEGETLSLRLEVDPSRQSSEGHEGHKEGSPAATVQTATREG